MGPKLGFVVFVKIRSLDFCFHVKLDNFVFIRSLSKVLNWLAKLSIRRATISSFPDLLSPHILNGKERQIPRSAKDCICLILFTKNLFFFHQHLVDIGNWVQIEVLAFLLLKDN